MGDIMSGKGMDPKKGYNNKKWYENFVQINWDPKGPQNPKCKKCNDKGCKCNNSPQEGKNEP